uniref:Uncharacterized protein n=1 Tax=Parascaris equorum TaxID=6256 RepID=A0A914R7I3_PAREQ
MIIFNSVQIPLLIDPSESKVEKLNAAQPDFITQVIASTALPHLPLS